MAYVRVTILNSSDLRFMQRSSKSRRAGKYKDSVGPAMEYSIDFRGLNDQVVDFSKLNISFSYQFGVVKQRCNKLKFSL